jgi:hypothetical protein
MGQPIAANGYSFDPVTGTFRLLKDNKTITPVRAFVESGYNRKKGLKSLVRANLNPNQLYINPNRSIEGYDLILAIDTNTRQLDNEQVSLTAVVVGKNVNVQIPGNIVMDIGVGQCFDFRNAKCKPENLGWYQIIQMLQRNPSFNDQMKVAFIVDSDLGNLKAFNEQIKPILNDYFLPNNFTLIYASAENPTESIANKMIAEADSVSRNLLKYIIENNILDNLTESDSNLFTHSRIWNMP